MFASFRSMTDEHNWNLVLFHRVFDASEGWIASFCDSLLFCTFESSSMLLKSRFWFAHEESIHTLVEIFTSHVVIDYANSFCIYGILIYIVNVVFNFCQLTFLFNYFYRLTTILSWSTFLFCLSCLLWRLVENRLLSLQAFYVIFWLLTKICNIILRRINFLCRIELTMISIIRTLL